MHYNIIVDREYRVILNTFIILLKVSRDNIC